MHTTSVSEGGVTNWWDIDDGITHLANRLEYGRGYNFSGDEEYPGLFDNQVFDDLKNSIDQNVPGVLSIAWTDILQFVTPGMDPQYSLHCVTVVGYRKVNQTIWFDRHFLYVHDTYDTEIHKVDMEWYDTSLGAGIITYPNRHPYSFSSSRYYVEIVPPLNQPICIGDVATIKLILYPTNDSNWFNYGNHEVINLIKSDPLSGEPSSFYSNWFYNGDSISGYNWKDQWRPGASEESIVADQDETEYSIYGTFIFKIISMPVDILDFQKLLVEKIITTNEYFTLISDSFYGSIINFEEVSPIPISINIRVRDMDGDGYDSQADCVGGTDCNDEDASIFPNAQEICDNKDNNCDEIIDSFEESRNCGLGICAGGKETRLCTNGSWSNWSTCSTFHLARPEECNGLDDDCDGIIPSNELDIDWDGYLSCNDCNDNDPTIHPGALEICDSVDNNCVSGIDEGCYEVCDGIDNNGDGRIDEGFWYYLDEDGDGYGNKSSNPIVYCTNPPSNYAKNNLDCDDTKITCNLNCGDFDNNGIRDCEEFITINSSWPTYQHDYSNTGKSSDNGIGLNPIKRFCTMITNDYVGSQIVNNSAGDFFIVYGSIYGPILEKVGYDGSFKWSTNLGYMIGAVSTTPTITANGIVLVKGDNGLAAVRDTANYGQLLWTTTNYGFDSGSYVPARLGIGGRIYMDCNFTSINDLGICAFDENGVLLWRKTYGWGVQHWSKFAVGPDNTVYYVGNSPTGLVALNYDGTLKWQTGDIGFLNGGPLISNDGLIYVGTDLYDGTGWHPYIFAYKPNGNLKWSLKLREGDCDPILALASDGTLVAHCDNDLYFITNISQNGQISNSLTNFVHSPIGLESVLIINSSDIIYALDNEEYYPKKILGITTSGISSTYYDSSYDTTFVLSAIVGIDRDSLIIEQYGSEIGICELR